MTCSLDHLVETIDVNPRTKPGALPLFHSSLIMYLFYSTCWLVEAMLRQCMLCCRAFNQDQVVMDFLRQPAKSQRGLPARPVVGCAVSIRLDLPPAVIEEWFGK